MIYQRIAARDIQPGMFVARARTHRPVFVRDVRMGPKAISIVTRERGAYDRKQPVYARPQHHQKWWRFQPSTPADSVYLHTLRGDLDLQEA